MRPLAPWAVKDVSLNRHPGDTLEIYEHSGLSSRLPVVKKFTDLTPDEVLLALVQQLRPHLHNVIGVTIGKGGTGKTTLASNLAFALAEQQSQLAESGKPALPILHLELDSNGNSRSDFGIRGTVFDDDGRAFYETLVDDRPFRVIRNVKPYLDVVPSGSVNGDISGAVSKLAGDHSLAAYLLLALLLAQIAHLYRWIIIDFSPSDKSNQRLGLATATHLVAPVKGSDHGVLEGLGTLAGLVRDIKKINPEVGIAAIGFLAFKKVKGEPTSELTNLRRTILAMVEEARIPPEVVLDDYIREAAILAKQCRNGGMPAKELALAALGILPDPEAREDEEDTMIPRPRDDNGRLIDPQKATDLADDYTHLAGAVIRQVRRRNNLLKGAA